MPEVVSSPERWDGYIVGTDAIDIARITGVQLHRAPCRTTDAADTSWQVADLAIQEGADPAEFFMDPSRLCNSDASTVIHGLAGFIRGILHLGVVD